jgi:hypothetical protein
LVVGRHNTKCIHKEEKWRRQFFRSGAGNLLSFGFWGAPAVVTIRSTRAAWSTRCIYTEASLAVTLVVIPRRVSNWTKLATREMPNAAFDVLTNPFSERSSPMHGTNCATISEFLYLAFVSTSARPRMSIIFTNVVLRLVIALECSAKYTRFTNKLKKMQRFKV